MSKGESRHNLTQEKLAFALKSSEPVARLDRARCEWCRTGLHLKHLKRIVRPLPEDGQSLRQ